MTAHLATIHRDIVGPGLRLLPPSMGSRDAKVMLLAIGLQESRFTARLQRPIRTGAPNGPARGFWQFERGGGVKGVMTHSASAAYARIVCFGRGVEFKAMPVWSALAEDDLLACAFARLLLFTDPRPLPKLGDEDGAWSYYVANWRPGKPHRQTWAKLYGDALAEVGG